MRCAFCNYEFDEMLTQGSCAGCSKFGGCNMIKCPRCGYEVPPEPKWLKGLTSLLKKEKD